MLWTVPAFSHPPGRAYHRNCHLSWILPCPATNSPHWPLPLATGFPGERWVKKKDCKCLMVGEEETHLYIGPDNLRHDNRETAKKSLSGQAGQATSQSLHIFLLIFPHCTVWLNTLIFYLHAKPGSSFEDLLSSESLKPWHSSLLC